LNKCSVILCVFRYKDKKELKFCPWCFHKKEGKTQKLLDLKKKENEDILTPASDYPS
jgi:hypothetical protein